MIILRQKQFGWFRDFVDWANKKVDPNWKTEKEIEEERRRAREEEKARKGQDITNKISSISRQHKIALDIEKESSKYLPTWGDGDEYPQFYVVRREEDRYNSIGDIRLGYQTCENYHWNGKYWEETELQRNPRRIINLKQDILKNLISYRKEYSEIDYLDKKKVDEVLNYLDNLIKIINKSSL